MAKIIINFRMENRIFRIFECISVISDYFMVGKESADLAFEIIITRQLILLIEYPEWTS